jgi:hypothetical protein
MLFFPPVNNANGKPIVEPHTNWNELGKTNPFHSELRASHSSRATHLRHVSQFYVEQLF